MSKKIKVKAKSQTGHSKAASQKLTNEKSRQLVPWYLFISVITAICLAPMLDNELTNWDDQFYIINNSLLRGPDWKGIFTEPVVGNYHPVTIISLAFNYAISGSEPGPYLSINYLLHLANTLLVFYLIWNISGKNKLVAAFTALIFGIHPMHVESVAWASERKDVLYTLFFLLALIRYWKFLEQNKRSDFWKCFVFFVLSILSKPSAVILPLVFLLLDYWKGRRIGWNEIREKIPFLALSIVIGIVTMQIQSPLAVIGLDRFSIIDRILFACYVLMTYFIRFFVPYPLSAFHPFPTSGELGWPILVSPLFVIALLFVLWFFRKNKVVVFGFMFYVINLLLVLQVISIGLTIVSERYTYVPYIGLAFMIAMIAKRIRMLKPSTLWPVTGLFMIVLGVITFKRADVWQNSGILWTDVIDKFPASPHPRTNRANYISKIATEASDKRIKDSLFAKALEDCNTALQLKPKFSTAYEKRCLIYVDLRMDDQALADADSLIMYDPGNKIGYDVRGTVYYRRNEPDKALEGYNKCIEINPEDHRSYSNRGAIYMNFYKEYTRALEEFNKAIDINPQGSYLFNRSSCYYKLGDLPKAKQDAIAAMEKGTNIPDGYKALLQLR